ncbi:hypothetical protein CVT25_002566 [Psilocybe cyanescens]|uniref:Pentacotripeptide-repeat region of PRORP domain-containing protein n=1 Tax=Psilocybe cyanescens TaxID=93625 RepID=A0A409WLD4_PSICY|nr:hypothetical protein CVT25_002566 [Psilocybe cyanescens]
MLAAAFQIGKVAPRACIRNFSTPAQNYIASLRRGWRTPLWNLVHSLRQPQDPNNIYDILRDNQLSSKQFDVWARILQQPDIAQAVQVVQSAGFRIRLSQPGDGRPPVPPLPPWALLSIVAHLVKTPNDASGPLMELVFSHLESVPPEIQGPLLVLTAHHLAQHNLLVPLQRVMNAFLAALLPKRDQEAQFNAFLRALSRMPFRSGEGTMNALIILQTMDDRALRVAPDTYRMLLNEDFATLPLARRLFVRVMKQENFAPPPKLLEAFLRVVTKHGREDLALKFYEAIQRTTSGANAGVDPKDADTAYKARFRAKTLMLNSFDKRTEALNFIDSVSSTSSSLPFTTTTSLPPSRSPTTSSDPKYPSLSSYNETSAFHIAAKDHTVSVHRLISIFLSLPSAPTIVTYTILIRGLLARGAYPKAEVWWLKLAKQASITMDRHALVAGVQALIRNGKPDVGFMYLEKYVKKSHEVQIPSPPPAASPAPAPSPHTPPTPTTQRLLPAPGENSIELTTISVNEILVSLNRISRPDVVFRLFTHMNVLYSTPPNSATLSILLQAARMATRKDDEDALAGVFAKIKLLDPFKRTRMMLRNTDADADADADDAAAVDERTQERARAVNDILSCVGHPSRGALRRYVNGANWTGVEPLEFGRRVFLQALFGRAAASGMPVYERVLQVRAPAAAVRAAYDSPPSFIPSAPTPYVFVPPEPSSKSTAASTSTPAYTLLTASGTSHFPSISLTNNNVLNYIQLLCVGNRVAEVPLVLAWARELGVQPSRSTLALALVVWSEVSQMAPLVALWQGRKDKAVQKAEGQDQGQGQGMGKGEGKKEQQPKPESDPDMEEGGEYGRLVRWIRGWVGEERMPMAEDIQKWRIVVHKMRTGSAYDAAGDGFTQAETAARGEGMDDEDEGEDDD